MGFGVVEIENYDNWLWFLKCMKLVILDADQESTVIFSDREKGLISAVSSVFSSPCHVFCIKHIIRNMNLKFNMTFIKDLVWKAALSTSRDSFEETLKELGNIDANAAEYLKNIPPKHWASFAITNATHGHKTNNVAESFNASIRHCKASSYLKLARHIIDHSVEKLC